MRPPSSYSKFLARLEEIAHVNSAFSVLHWDQEIHMPPKGVSQRAKTIGYLAGMSHRQFTALDRGGELSALRRWAEKHSGTKEAAVIREVWRSYTREKKLPGAFVREFSELASHAQTAWADARAKSDFKAFAPYLTRIVDLKKKEAEYVGYEESPYDALLDAYEPDLTASRITPIFNELRDFLTVLIKQIRASKHQPVSPGRLKGKFPLDAQREFNLFVAGKMGFDLEAGRMDASTHPFTTHFHAEDVRITTRYREHDLLYSLGSTIHEVGHALYEQGIPPEHFGTPLGESLSLGIHESQSRVWENNIGKSRAFWKFFYPKLRKEFPRPFGRISFEDFYRTLNRVQPSLIRTEADEVTYNLHIILRFEIENALIEGSLAVKDLPEVWNEKMKKYLGVRVPNDRVGVLQDVHWSGGMIGYFPTYTLGNLYAAQFYRAARREMPRLDTQFASGNFVPMREWLRKKIHAHGKFYAIDRLVRNVTGESLQTKYFIDYLKKKYSEIYRLR
jgi:carboxypeptidase Taq